MVKALTRPKVAADLCGGIDDTAGGVCESHVADAILPAEEHLRAMAGTMFSMTLLLVSTAEERLLSMMGCSGTSN